MYHLTISPNEKLWCLVCNGDSDETLQETIKDALKKLGLQRYISRGVRKPNHLGDVCRQVCLTPKQMDALCKLIDGVWCPANLDKDKNTYACSYIVLPREYRG
jgi:hypothetical protein